jgi:Integrase core domain
VPGDYATRLSATPPRQNAFVERFHRTYGQECLQIYQPRTLQEVREVTEAFLQHYNEERPHQGRACGNVPPRVAFPTLPAFPALPEQVNPDTWLASLDQKMYLRHVGRDGCVDVDLTTYYVGPQMAGRTVLLQVQAESRQFAVWSQDQIVKLLPIKGLLGQEMALDNYLQYIKQEALAAPRRSSVRGGRQSPPAFSVGRRSLISSFIRRVSRTLASPAGKWREHVVLG